MSWDVSAVSPGIGSEGQFDPIGLGVVLVGVVVGVVFFGVVVSPLYG